MSVHVCMPTPQLHVMYVHALVRTKPDYADILMMVASLLHKTITNKVNIFVITHIRFQCTDVAVATPLRF